MRKGFALVLILFTIIFSGIVYQSDDLSSMQLRKEANFQVIFKYISSIIRVPLTQVFARNDTIIAGDIVGGINIWSLNQKKGKFEFQDTSRQKTPVVPPLNPVKQIDRTEEGILALNQYGQITAYAINSASKITAKVQYNNTELLSQIVVIKQSNKTYIAGLTREGGRSICIYGLNQSIIRPFPIVELACNRSASTTTNLTGLSYDPMNNLLAAGDRSKANFYQLNFTSSNLLTYLCSANLPKAEAEGFDSQFSNGTLLAVSDLWVNSIIIDVTVPSAKVLSSQRTENLVKTGETTKISTSIDEKTKQTLLMINARNILKGYGMGKNQKITQKGDSRVLGGTKNFTLMNTDVLISISDISVLAYKLGNSSSNQFLNYLDDQPIDSKNHFAPVNRISYFNNTLVTVSEGGPYNFKLWKVDGYSITLVDEKTLGYFSLLKSGNINLKDALMIPPLSKANTNQSLHIATAGSDPFELILVNLNSQGKIQTVNKSNGSHFSNITAIFLSSDKKKILTTSMDTLIKIWPLASNRQSIADNQTSTVTTKAGPINVAVQDKSGQYYVFGHCSTNTTTLTNLTLWKEDSKKGLIKIAQNVPQEAHQSNLTHLLFSKDNQYIISFSESGQLRLWQHKNFTIIDLLASLSIGATNVSLQVTSSNRLLLQSASFFTEYSFDFNGFILEGRKGKDYYSPTSSMRIVNDAIFSGDNDGSIRIYQHSD